jgi:hypothetical protein
MRYENQIRLHRFAMRLSFAALSSFFVVLVTGTVVLAKTLF